MPDKLLAVAHATQETLFFCGPATAQMVLSGLGVVSPAVPPTWQAQSWDFIKTNTNATRPSRAPDEPPGSAFPEQKCERCSGWKCWATTPTVLTSLINTSQGVAQYAISTHVIESSATGVLLDSIDQGLPGIALVYGWKHWLVVDGYRHDEPGWHPVAGRKLNGVWIRDPQQPSVHYIAWPQWRDTYLSFVPCGTYKNKMVVVAGDRVSKTALPIDVQPYQPPPDPFTMMRPLIPATVAINRVLDQIDPLRDSRLRGAFHAAEAKTARLVQRLDEPDSYYYIVSFEAAARDTARVIVDAFDGTLLQASGIESAADRMPPYIPSTSAVGRLQAFGESDPDALPFRVRMGTVGEHPVLVWKPCKESTSPLLPFYQLSVGDSFVYFRIDGEQFEELTDGLA